MIGFQTADELSELIMIFQKSMFQHFGQLQ